MHPVEVGAHSEALGVGAGFGCGRVGGDTVLYVGHLAELKTVGGVVAEVGPEYDAVVVAYAAFDVGTQRVGEALGFVHGVLGVVTR